MFPNQFFNPRFFMPRYFQRGVTAPDSGGGFGLRGWGGRVRRRGR